MPQTKWLLAKCHKPNDCWQDVFKWNDWRQNECLWDGYRQKGYRRNTCKQHGIVQNASRQNAFPKTVHSGWSQNDYRKGMYKCTWSD